MREITCLPLDTIKGTVVHRVIVETGEKYRKNSAAAAWMLGAILLVLSVILLPMLLTGAVLALFSLVWTVASILSLFSPSGATFDLASTLFSLVMSLVGSLVGGITDAIIFLIYFVLCVAVWNSVRVVLSKSPNVTITAILADNPAELKAATTAGIFGFFYRYYENAANRILWLKGQSMDKITSSDYPNGTLVLCTPAARWPIAKGRAITRTGWVDDRLVVIYYWEGIVYAAGIFNKADGEAVLKKLKDSIGMSEPLETILPP